LEFRKVDVTKSASRSRIMATAVGVEVFSDVLAAMINKVLRNFVNLLERERTEIRCNEPQAARAYHGTRDDC
jgi:hypothetical protein